MNEAATKANNLEKRMISFAASIVLLSSKLPKTPQARHIADQILRSGTAAAANYAEARGAESRADFIHKLKVVSKELNETSVWLELTSKRAVGRGDDCWDSCRKSRALQNYLGVDTHGAGVGKRIELVNRLTSAVVDGQQSTDSCHLERVRIP